MWTPPTPVTGLRWYLDIGVTCLVGLCLALPSIGGGEALAQAAHELEPPRVQALWRAALLTAIEQKAAKLKSQNSR